MYQLLPLKWRPQCFNDFVGHENIVKFIINSLKLNKIYSTYLFYGPRGVGKTSLSRLFAKTLNCINLINYNPCQNCNICLSISSGQSVDLIEIDAATYSKVEDIKNILDKIYYLPILMKYKIYIFDEIHMLSRHSFNSLLKVLEETPNHVKFILATTDLNKIPDTILSRCMSFYLKPLSNKNILDRLILIANKELFKYDIEALKIISLYANGSMRDAIILLDQLLLSTDSSYLTVKEINYFLNRIDEELIFLFLNYLFISNYNKILYCLNIFLKKNIDFNYLINNILEKLHFLFIMKIIPNFDLNVLNIKNSIELLKLDKLVSLKDINYFYKIFYIAKKDLILTSDKKIIFEFLIFKLIYYKKK